MNQVKKVKINYRRIYYMLNQIPAVGNISIQERLEMWVSNISDGRTYHVSELRASELSVLMTELEATAYRCNPELKKLDKWRRRTIKAICEYHSLMGYYKNLSPAERVEKAKGEAVKANGVVLSSETSDTKRKLRLETAFNQISVGKLQALYNGKLRQNRILRNANQSFEEDLTSPPTPPTSPPTPPTSPPTPPHRGGGQPGIS